MSDGVASIWVSPSPDSILGQVQKESESLSFFTSGPVLKSTKRPGVPQSWYCHIGVPALCVQTRVNHRRPVRASLHPCCPPSFLVAALSTRLPDPCLDHLSDPGAVLRRDSHLLFVLFSSCWKRSSEEAVRHLKWKGGGCREEPLPPPPPTFLRTGPGC